MLKQGNNDIQNASTSIIYKTARNQWQENELKCSKQNHALHRHEIIFLKFFIDQKSITEYEVKRRNMECCINK